MQLNDTNRIAMESAPRSDWSLSLDGTMEKPLPTSESMEKKLLQSLRRRWLLALSLGIVTAVAGGYATWHLLPPKYTTRALLHLSMQPGQTMFLGDMSTNPEEFLSFQRTQTVLLKSRTVIEAALKKPEVAECADVRQYGANWLADSLRIETHPGPEVLKVTLTGRHPEELPVVLNGLLQAYLEDQEEKERHKRPVRLEQISEKYREISESLSHKRELLRKQEAGLGVDSPEMRMARFQAGLQNLAAMEKEVMQSKVAVKNTQMELALLKQRENTTEGYVSAEIEQLLTRDETYKALLHQKLQLTDETSRISNLAAPKIREQMTGSSRLQLENIDKELAKRRQALLPTLSGQERARLEVRLTVLKEQEKEMAAVLRLQQEEVKRLGNAIRKPERAPSNLDNLRDEVSLAEQVLKKIGEQRDLMSMEPALPLRVSVLEPADVPRTRDMKQPIKFIGLVGIGLFGLTVLGVSLREFFSGWVYSEADVVRDVGMNLLGTLPALPKSTSLPADRMNGELCDHAFLKVSMDTICTRLVQERTEQNRQVFMITSARRDEGKTSFASHLAAHMAENGCKTLFMDCDLFHPHAHRQFGVPAEPGFSAILQGSLSADEATWATSHPGLFMIPAGKWNIDAVMALAHDKAKVIFDQLKPGYDFIIVNASPVLTGADALLLGKHADAVIVSVLCDVSQIASIRDAHQCLVKIGATVLGTTVIENVRKSHS